METLINRLRGRGMPEGIVKSNGRLEATEVDVAAKYPGRLATVTVNEGDEVTAGQVVAPSRRRKQEPSCVARRHHGPLAAAALSGQSPEAPEGSRRLRREGLTAKARAER